MIIVLEADMFDNYSTDGQMHEFTEDQFWSIIDNGHDGAVSFPRLRKELLAGDCGVYHIVKEITVNDMRARLTKESSQ